MFNFYIKFKFLVVVLFYAISFKQFYYIKFLHVLSLVEFNQRKTLMCYLELTKYVLIRIFKCYRVFLIKSNF